MSLEPVDALRRIAFLLERSRASTYRVRAYRTAAATLLGLPEDEVRRRAEDGTLTDLTGIGPSTAAVVAAAARGEVPEALAALEADAAAPLAEGGEEYRAALRGDLHAHSDWSDGGSPVEEMAATAVELGHEYLAMTDHSPTLKVANGLSPARLTKQLALVDAVNTAFAGEFTMLKAIEVDILEDGTLGQEDALLDRLDIRVASVHSKLRSDSRTMTRRMLAAVQRPHVNVLGHCTGRLVQGERGTRPPSQFDAEAVFTACREHGTAVEINSRPERQDPPDDLLRLALEIGCLFSIDTDAHAPGQLDFLDHGCARAAAAGVPLDRIVNTWPLEDLLEWARG